MKKITFSLITLFSAAVMLAQTYTTGAIALTTGFTGKIDVTNSLVTLTLVGPSTGWLGLAFDADSMDDIGKDCVIFDGTNVTDRTFDGIGTTPPADPVQDWTTVTNTVDSGVRTVVATRARDTGDSNDYVFTASTQPLTLTWARKTTNFNLTYHGNPGGCGSTVANFTLGTQDFKTDSFKMSPNPANGFTNISLPAYISSGELKIYDNLGRVVLRQSISANENKVSTSGFSQGSYLMVIRTDYGNATKTLVVE